MRNLFTHHYNIQVLNGNVKKSLQNHFNKRYNAHDFSYQCVPQITIPKQKLSFQDNFEFSATVILKNWNGNIFLTTNFIGKGRCLPPRMEHYGQNIVINNDVLIEYQETSTINKEGKINLKELVPHEYVL